MDKQKTKTIDKQKKHNAIILIISFLTVLFIEALGIIILKNASLNPSVFFLIEFMLSCLAFVLCPINAKLQKNYISKISKMNVAEIQSFYLSQRENSEKTAKKQLSILKKIRVLTYVYTVFLLLLAFTIAFLAYIPGEISLSTPFCFVSMWIFYKVFSWLRKPYSKKEFEENEFYVKKEDFPYLYKLAEKARDTIGCKGEIRITFLADANAGIAQIGKAYSIQLGSILLNTSSEDEIFCILLHEFSHIIWENKYCAKEAEYSWRITTNEERADNAVLNKLFSFTDCVYMWNYELFRYASSLNAEEYADQAMSKYGDGKVAASSLIKLKYFSYFTWENGTTDSTTAFAQESVPDNFVTLAYNKFKKAISENSEKWNKLIDVEILSRNASHPTVKMRLDSLGVTKTETIDSNSSKEYLKDAENALKFTDALYAKYNKEVFEEAHCEYVKAEEKVQKWIDDGKPIIAEEYRFIVESLRTLGRATEAMEVCDKAIETLSPTAANYAYYIKGNYLIHKYDVEGLELIYKAMENHNFIDEGLSMIGCFCCMTGRQKELDEYREKATALAQEQMDKYNKLSELKKDDILSTETLPSGMLDSILEYISSVDNGTIEKIYLVRKTITADFHASVFVVKFSPFRNDKAKEEAWKIMDKIFQHLDTSSDHQFCLYDYGSVSYIKFDEIPNSCVYTKKHTLLKE